MSNPKTIRAMYAVVTGQCPPSLALDHIDEAGRVINKMLVAGARDAIENILTAHNDTRYMALAHSTLWHQVDYTPAGIFDNDPYYYRMFAIRCVFANKSPTGNKVVDHENLTKVLRAHYGSILHISEYLYSDTLLDDCVAVHRLRSAIIDRAVGIHASADHLACNQFPRTGKKRLLIGVLGIAPSEVPSPAHYLLEPPQSVIPGMPDTCAGQVEATIVKPFDYPIESIGMPLAISSYAPVREPDYSRSAEIINFSPRGQVNPAQQALELDFA